MTTPALTPAPSLETRRRERDAARRTVMAGAEQVKADLAARSIGGRITDKAKGEAMAMVDEAAAVARESKGVIAATIGALLVWTFRDTLAAALQRRCKSGAVQDRGASAEPGEAATEDGR